MEEKDILLTDEEMMAVRIWYGSRDADLFRLFYEAKDEDFREAFMQYHRKFARAQLKKVWDCWLKTPFRLIKHPSGNLGYDKSDVDGFWQELLKMAESN